MEKGHEKSNGPKTLKFVWGKSEHVNERYWRSECNPKSHQVSMLWLFSISKWLFLPLTIELDNLA